VAAGSDGDGCGAATAVIASGDATGITMAGATVERDSPGSMAAAHWAGFSGA
jgi:hypothetical protein